MKLRAGICRSRDHFSDRYFATFWQHWNKSESSNRGEFQARQEHYLACFLDLTFCGVDEAAALVATKLNLVNDVIIANSTITIFKLRAPAAHGVSS